MPALRNRKMDSPSSASAEKQPLVDRRAPHSPRYQRTPPPPRRSTRTLNITISLLILAFFVVYSQNHSSKTPRVFEPQGRRLPEYYGVCSREGKVYTVPPEGGLGAVECVVVRGKEVVDTGSLDLRKAGGLQIFYLPPDYSLTPGLIDSHGHPLEYGYYLQLPLQGSRSVSEAVQRVEAFARDHAHTLPKGAWIEGMGWDQNLWSPQDFPTAADLETSAVLHGLPISLARIDVHAEWVSEAVLDMLGDLPDEVPGGHIVRYPNGKPTGVFVDNAINLLNEIRPKMSDKQREIYLARMATDGLAKGLTGVHNARASLEDVAFFKRMAGENKLPMRFYTMIHCGDPPTFCGDKVEQVQDAGDGRLTVRAVKLFGDGALGSRGAALLEDYSDQPGWKGLLLEEEDKWEPLIRQWYEAVNVHTIGDRANKVVIDAMEGVIGDDKHGGRARRLRLEHAQIMRPEDLERAARLGIIASYQPTHATSDMWYAEQRLGPERIKGAYAWRTYLNHGGRIALGSDFPVESIDPLKGFYAAVTRLSESGESPHDKGGWYPSEKLTREEALRGMTADAAYASFSNTTGSLTPGKRFDAVVWDDDLLTAPIEEILEIAAKATIMDGQVVSGRLEV
ncbi:hypothetical protein EHS25_001434 [Saitozyma podzolica]|uniref:Amidohydrolase 3 domain-containing protein n=1 Tax=Saitozyma podzolica TaxID=1890683 RepID=A0A427YG04_9TREE|nr:hypothetical protein EHS25_001434 [Saitozyma podzolica]